MAALLLKATCGGVAPLRVSNRRRGGKHRRRRGKHRRRGNTAALCGPLRNGNTAGGASGETPPMLVAMRTLQPARLCGAARWRCMLAAAAAGE